MPAPIGEVPGQGSADAGAADAGANVPPQGTGGTQQGNPPQPRPQHSQHRGPFAGGPSTGGPPRRDQQGHGRNQQAGGRGGRGGQQGRGGHDQRGKQHPQGGQHPQRGQHPQGGPRAPQRQQGGGNFDRGQKMSGPGFAGPTPATGRAQGELAGETPDVSDVQAGNLSESETVALPPQPAASDGETLAPGGAAALPAASPADAAALAPFAEDIEIDESLTPPPAPRRAPTGRDMLINVVEGEEVRIAVIRRGQLEELYMERSSAESHIGNIYKGRVTNVEPSIQAAFVDFGIGKNGFLHISDVHPQYFPKKHQPRLQVQRRMPQGQRLAPRPGGSGAAPAGSGHAFVPPTAPASTPQGEASGIAPTGTGAGVLEHQVAQESPVVQLDEALVPQEPGTAATEIASSQAGPIHAQDPQLEGAAAEARGNGEFGADHPAEAAVTSAEEIAYSAAGSPADPSIAAAREASDPAQNPDPAAEQAQTAEESAASEQEQEADFGSAYKAEFADDDEFMEDYESAEIDDGHMKPMEKVGRKTPRRDRPPIQQCLRRGQEVIVQVTKEGIGTKGPTLTTYVSCPGRYLVMMPGMAQLGVSRKIEDLDQRRELKRTLQELNPPRNLGFIIRTAGTEVAKKELQGDLNYLVRMWKVIANRIRSHKAPVELYEESDLVIRTIRDVFNDEIDRIVVDNEQVASRVRDFLSIVDPRSAGIVELYTGTMPLFQKFGVEREIEKINSRRVEIPNGGSLVIDSTEALVAIDVNSGRYREMRDAELTAFNMNKEALKEVVRQLRLRDLGGVIVIDFIDMREERHKREIERLLREELKNDRAKTKVLRMSLFCMIEMTRQRVRPSLKRSIYMDCPHCHGSALIKTPESVSLDVMRRLAAGASRMDTARIEVRAYPTVATFLLNRKRKGIVELEEKTGKRINISADDTLAGDQIVIQLFDPRESLINAVV